MRAPVFVFSVGLLGCGADVHSLSDANNFSYTGDVTIPAFATAPGTDLEICWDQVTDDIQCHGLDPSTDINMLTMSRFAHLSEADVESGLSDDSLQQSSLTGTVDFFPSGQTCTMLSEFSFGGTAISVPNEYDIGSTYLLTAQTGTQVMKGTRVMVFLTPTEGETNTTVTLESGCGVLDFQGDIESLEAVSIPADGSWVVDWSGLTTTGLGNLLNISSIDGLMLGHYTESRAELQTQLLDLELLSDESYSVPISGTTGYDLATLPGFGGLTTDGTWILALTCSICANPAPLFLTVLVPE
ncbi:MAG: hypothetical protein ACI8RZ_007660 [Myxococcota bacterium]|jgi:hypothetical protein